MPPWPSATLQKPSLITYREEAAAEVASLERALQAAKSSGYDAPRRFEESLDACPRAPTTLGDGTGL
jgi:hypothetical protein